MSDNPLDDIQGDAHSKDMGKMGALIYVGALEATGDEMVAQMVLQTFFTSINMAAAIAAAVETQSDPDEDD